MLRRLAFLLALVLTASPAFAQKLDVEAMNASITAINHNSSSLKEMARSLGGDDREILFSVIDLLFASSAQLDTLVVLELLRRDMIDGRDRAAVAKALRSRVVDTVKPEVCGATLDYLNSLLPLMHSQALLTEARSGRDNVTKACDLL
jgi:hypothetical protein